MKYTFDSRTLSESPRQSTGRAPSEPGCLREERSGFMLKGASLRLVAVVALSSILLFFFARSMFATFIFGTFVMALQAMMIEVIFGVLLNRKRLGDVAGCERAARRRRWTVIAWWVDGLILAALVIVLAVIYFCF